MEPVRDYELRALFTRVVEVLEQLGIPYMVVGGFAAIFYGEPQLTLDVDIVVDMKEEHIEPFVATFPVAYYYVSEEGIRDSPRRHYPFNVIQPATGAKIDMMPLTTDPLTLGAFERRQRITYDEAGHTATIISAEDLVLSKLSHIKRRALNGICAMRAVCSSSAGKCWMWKLCDAAHKPLESWNRSNAL